MNKVKKIIEKAIVRKPVLLDTESEAIWVFLEMHSSSLQNFKESTKSYGVHTDVAINIDGKVKKYTFEEFKNLLGF